jgi:multicomponent Na+:H+ antiporter subunit F
MTTVASSVLLPAMLLLLLTLAVGLVRALRGPSLQDRMLSILLIGSGGVALLLLMSGFLNMPALIDVALVLALLAVLAAAALTRIEVDHD